MKIIKLSGGQDCLVDDGDYDWLSCFNWHFGSKRYAVAKKAVNGRQKSLFMHRLIMNPPDGFIVDHINNNGLDNRRQNLRLCTRRENTHNRKIISKNNKSGYKGVWYAKNVSKWRAEISIDGKTINLGLFLNATDAARAYDEAAIKYHGAFARLNFPKP